MPESQIMRELLGLQDDSGDTRSHRSKAILNGIGAGSPEELARAEPLARFLAELVDRIDFMDSRLAELEKLVADPGRPGVTSDQNDSGAQASQEPQESVGAHLEVSLRREAPGSPRKLPGAPGGA